MHAPGRQVGILKLSPVVERVVCADLLEVVVVLGGRHADDRGPRLGRQLHHERTHAT